MQILHFLFLCQQLQCCFSEQFLRKPLEEGTVWRTKKIQFVCDAKKISKALKHCCWTTVLRTSPSAIGALLCFIVQLQWSSTCRQPEHSPPLYPVQHQTVYCIYITPSRLLMYLYLYYSIQEGCWCICSCILYLSALNCRENIKCSSYFTERQHHLVKMWKAGK